MNKKGERCGTFCLRNEDFCVNHSDSERASKLRQKMRDEQKRIMKLMYPEWGEGKRGSTLEITPYGIMRDFKLIRRRLLRDKSVPPHKKVSALIVVDRQIVQCQKIFQKLAEKQKKSFEEKLKIAEREKAEKQVDKG